MDHHNNTPGYSFEPLSESMEKEIRVKIGTYGVAKLNFDDERGSVRGGSGWDRRKTMKAIPKENNRFCEKCGAPVWIAKDDTSSMTINGVPMIVLERPVGGYHVVTKNNVEGKCEVYAIKKKNATVAHRCIQGEGQ